MPAEQQEVRIGQTHPHARTHWRKIIGCHAPALMQTVAIPRGNERVQEQSARLRALEAQVGAQVKSSPVAR
eukprot:5840445-Amphidinium_carterae.1